MSKIQFVSLCNDLLCFFYSPKKITLYHDRYISDVSLLYVECTDVMHLRRASV